VRFALFLLLAGAIALPRAGTAAERERVNAVLASHPAAIDRVLAALRASLDRQGVDLVAVSAARIDPLDVARRPLDRSATGPVAYLWLDLMASQPTMYLLDVRSGLVYVRPLAVRADPDAVELELIRLVVDSSVEAILKGRALGVSRDEFERSLAPAPAPEAAPNPPPEPKPEPAPKPNPPPEPKPEPAPKPNPPPEPKPEPESEAAPESEFTWAITAGYSGTMLSTDSVSHGPELSAERRWPRLRLGVTLWQQLPLAVTRGDVDMRLLSSGIHLLVAFPAAITSHLSASLGLGAGVDATRVTPRGNGAQPAFWATDPLVLAMATIEHAFGTAVVSVCIGVDWDLLATRYLVARSDATSVVWTPWRWRPYAGLRLGFAF
jgi:hypothetical protein